MTAAVVDAVASSVSSRRLRTDWVAGFNTEPADDRQRAFRSWQSGTSTLTVSSLEQTDVCVAEDSEWVILFSGLLTNAGELDARCSTGNAAAFVLKLLALESERCFQPLRGPFAAVAWNRKTGKVIAARDHTGQQPLFYARDGRNGWWFSPSPDALVRQPGVSAEPDPVALSEWICDWYPAVEDTTYRDVKRVPPATALTFAAGSVSEYRYWNPWARATEWLTERDVDQFDSVLRRAVRRTTRDEPAAVFLSGGVDSISVAIAAADLAKDAGAPAPLALSLAFPGKVANEEPIQKGVAARLRLPQVMLPFAEAIGPRGLVGAALDTGADWPQPMLNIWAPAYLTLGRHAVEDARRTILTGRGGDEWLTISPWLLADQLKRGNLPGALRLLRMHARSNRMGFPGPAKLLWLAGCRPLASETLNAVAPAWWHRQRRRRLLETLPQWVAPGAALRDAIRARVDRSIQPARPPGSHYQRSGRSAVEHPAMTHDLEETQAFARRVGARQLHPYWDVDLIEMLHRVPPRLLMSDGRSKSVVRPEIARRLPGLGLESRQKVSAGAVFRTAIDAQTAAEWRRLKGVPVLSRLGVVAGDMADVVAQLHTSMRGRGQLWKLLAFENWLQHRQ